VKDQLHILHTRQQALPIEDVEPPKAESPMRVRLFKEVKLAGGQVVYADHLVAGGQQMICEIASDKSCSACN
jgi:hypothetical protein